jgi:S-(hydroxymethyl)glutathione dehydrogenase/alcohol dehydrogenase
MFQETGSADHSNLSFFTMIDYTGLKFRGAILRKIKKPLFISSELTIPVLKRGQVLVKLAYSGICKSQLMEIQGKRGEDKYLPHLLGHEGSGVVVAVGPGVKKVKPKNRIVLTWIKCKGIDADTPTFLDTSFGNINAGKVTTFNEFSVISENRCVLLPANIPMDVGALLGCAVLTGFGIIVRELKPKQGSCIAIFGLGGIGMSALIACLSLSPAKLIAVDINSKKLKLAKALGATHCINAANKNPVEEIKNLTLNAQGADYSVDCSGFASTIEQAFDSIKRGGKTVFASHPEAGQKISIDPFELINGKTLHGSWGGSSRPDIDIPLIGKLIKSKKIDLEKLISKKYTIKNINKAISDFHAGKVLRPLIKF